MEQILFTAEPLVALEAGDPDSPIEGMMLPKKQGQANNTGFIMPFY